MQTANPTPSPATSAPRIYYLDAMRGVLMLIGVFFHAALIYADPEVWAWIVSDDERSPFFTVLASTTNTFRMPAFFIISGFFALFTLDRYGVWRFFRVRLERLAVPLIAAAVFLNSLQAWVVYHMAHGGGPGFAAWLGQTRYLADGVWVQHLWFLVNLIIYFGAVAAVDALGIAARMRSGLSTLRRIRGAHLLFDGGRYVLWLPGFGMAVAALAALWPAVREPILGFISPFWLLWFTPFFIFGLWLHDDRRLQADFTCFHRWYAIALLLGIAARIWLGPAKDAPSLPLQIAAMYAQQLTMWLGCALCFAFFHRFLDRRSQFLAYMSDATYTIYLFHHVAVVYLGFALLDAAIGPYAKYLIISAVVSLVTVAVHHFVVLRFDLARYLFNGKRLSPRPR